MSLAGLPKLPPFDGQGTDLTPLFANPALGSIFKNASFTQYPACTPTGWPARGFPSGTHSPNNPTCTCKKDVASCPTDMTACNTHGCIGFDRNTFRKMGFSLRTDAWRCKSARVDLKIPLTQSIGRRHRLGALDR